jgi:hypothetical protein
VETIVLTIAYATAAYNFHRELGTSGSSWLVTTAGSGLNLTLAGWWYMLLSVPIYQFFLFRWIFRLCNWTVFLWRVARLDLEIVPTHPDCAAGLGFVGQALAPTSIIVFAASAVLCSSIGTQVIYRGASIEEFAIAFRMFVAVALIVFLTPFAVFMPRLAIARRNGLMKYGALATRYAQLFDRKWAGREALTEDEFLGTQDIQALADMGTSFDRIANMKLFPVELADLRALLIATLLPGVPLVSTQISIKDVLQILTKVIF